MVMPSSSGGGGGHHQSHNHKSVANPTVDSCHRDNVITTSSTGSHAHEHEQQDETMKHSHHHRHRHHHHHDGSSKASTSQPLPPTTASIRTMASPTSSASSVCSSSSSNDSCSSCDSCSNNVNNGQATTGRAHVKQIHQRQQQQSQQQQRLPTNSVSPHHHHATTIHPLTTSTSSLLSAVNGPSSSSSTSAASTSTTTSTSTSTNTSDNGIFSPVIVTAGSENGSTSGRTGSITSASGSSNAGSIPSRSRPTSPLKSGGAIGKTNETDTAHGEDMQVEQRQEQLISGSRDSSNNNNNSIDAPTITSVPLLNTGSNSRKSARRHSENGMTTPDEGVFPYSGTNATVPSDRQLNTLQEQEQQQQHVPMYAAPSTNTGTSFPSSHERDDSNNATSTTTNLMNRPFHHPSLAQLRQQSSSGSSSSSSNITTPSSTSSGATATIPNSSASTSARQFVIPVPGERRIPNEETRPARRKVHRVDTGDRGNITPNTVDGAGAAGNTSSSSNSSSQTPDHQYMSGSALGNVSRPPVATATIPAEQQQNGPTFQRPKPYSDSYFPASHQQYPASSTSTTARSASSTLRSSASVVTRRGEGDNSVSDPSSTFAAPAHVTSGSGNGDAAMSIDQGAGQNVSSSTSSNNNIHSKSGKKQSRRAAKQSPVELPRVDIATYPTTTLLHYLAALLTKITETNDAIRDGVSEEEQQNNTEHSGDTHMESGGQDARGEHDGDEDAPSRSGQVTPPAYGQQQRHEQGYNHSRTNSREPVTPAVPFPSPAMSRQGSQGSHKHYPSFTTDARLNAHRTYAHPSPSNSDQGEERRSGKGGVEEQQKPQGEKEDDNDNHSDGDGDVPSLPRYNFDRPPEKVEASTSNSTSGSSNARGGRSKPVRTKSNTILTSAAQALATPNATLCFHARNIPSISIEAYLVRISKYCPTTNEVFISLLVYFDRMSRLPNLSNLSASLPGNNTSNNHVNNTSSNSSASDSKKSSNTSQAANNADAVNVNVRPSLSMQQKSSVDNSNTGNSPQQSNPSTDSQATASNNNSTSNNASAFRPAHKRSSSNPGESTSSNPSNQQSQAPHSNFAVDSFNIHRLIIAGVTVASKFFSDVFYTNSRYAKVGGLPLPELNALELQFLLLNGFDLIVSPQELQRYANYLLIGALPPQSNEAVDRFGTVIPDNPSSRFSTRYPNIGAAISPGKTTTPAVSPPSSRSATPFSSRVPPNAATTAGVHSQNLFSLALRQQHAQREQLATASHYQQGPEVHPSTMQRSYTAPQVPGAVSNPASFSPASGLVDASARPKTSSRSASESSTSASEASTVVPSESSVDTERGELEHSTADEDTGADDDEDDVDGDSRMTDVSNAASPAVQSQMHSQQTKQNQPMNHLQPQTQQTSGWTVQQDSSRSYQQLQAQPQHHSHPQRTPQWQHPGPLQQQQQQQQQTQAYLQEAFPSNAYKGEKDTFAVPTRPRPTLSRSSSPGNGQRHPLLASSTGLKSSSNTSLTHLAHAGKSSSGVKAIAQGDSGSAPTDFKNPNSTAGHHRRDNSRTREWTIQQQQRLQQRGGSASASASDEDAEMADEE